MSNLSYNICNVGCGFVKSYNIKSSHSHFRKVDSKLLAGALKGHVIGTSDIECASKE